MAAREPPLPPDVFANVLGHLRTPIRTDDPVAERQQRASFRSAALVHRSYTLVAQRQLNESITVWTAEQAAAVNAAIDNGRASLALVRVITVDPRFDSIAWGQRRLDDDGAHTNDRRADMVAAWSAAVGAAVMAANALAQRCPGLVAVRAGGLEAFADDWRRAPAWPAVELIVGRSVGLDPVRMAREMLARPTSVFRALTLLYGGGWDQQTEIFDDGPTPAMHHLVRLQLGSRDQLFSLTGAIVGRSQPSIRTLVLYLQSSQRNVVRDALVAHMPPDAVYSSRYSAFPSLQRLVLAGEWPANLVSAHGPELLERLPPLLRDVTFEAITPTRADADRRERIRKHVDRALVFHHMASALVDHVEGALLADLHV